MNDSIAHRARKARKAAGLSQDEVARLGGPARPTLSRLERGAGQIPERFTIESLAKVLKVSPDWLITGNGQMMLIEAKHQNEGAAENVIPYQAPPPAFDQSLMESAILAVLKVIEVRKLTLSPERTLAGILAVYEAARAQGKGKVTDADVTPLVRLFLA